MREFVTAVQDHEDRKSETAQPYPFKVDGVVCNAYKPDDSQIAVFFATVGRGASNADRIAGVLNFFDAVLDKKSSDYLTGRLLDRTDNFKFEQVEDILEGLVEDWSGHPTQEAVASSASPKRTGSRSTRTTSK